MKALRALGSAPQAATLALLAFLPLSACAPGATPTFALATPTLYSSPYTPPPPTSIVQPTHPAPASTLEPSIQEIRRMGKGSAHVITASPNGAFYAIGGSQGVRFYDASALLEMAFFRADSTVYEVAISTDGQLFAISPIDALLVARTFDLRVLLAVEERGWLITFSRDNSLVAYVTSCLGVPECSDHVRVWNVTTSADLHDFSLESSGPIWHFNHLAFSPDSSSLAAAAENGVIYMWDIATASLLPSLTGHSAPVTQVAFSPDGATLASASEDRTVRLWDLTGQSPPQVVGPLPAPIDTISFRSDASAIMIHCENGLEQARDPTTGEILSSQADVHDPLADVLATIVARDGYVSPDVLAYSPDGGTLAVASFSSPGVFFFDAHSGQCLGVVQGERVIHLAYADSGGFFIVVQDERGVLIIDAATRKLIRTINTGYIYDAALSPGSRFLALNTFRGIELWEVPSAEMAATIPIGPSRNIAFSADGSAIFADRWPAHGVSEWGVPDGRLRSTYQFPSYPPYYEALGLDHRSIALYGDLKKNPLAPDQLIIDLYPIGGSSEPTRLEGITYYYVSLEFAPDGRLVLVPYVEALTFFDRETGRAIYTLHESLEDGSVPSDFAFTPDGHTIATVADDGEIIIWDISSIVAAANH